MGGTAGMVRGIIAGWQRPFTINQLKIAFHRRHPDLNLGDCQVDDIIEAMVRSTNLERIDESTFRRARHRVVYPKFVKATVSVRKRQLKFIFQ